MTSAPPGRRILLALTTLLVFVTTPCRSFVLASIALVLATPDADTTWRCSLRTHTSSACSIAQRASISGSLGHVRRAPSIVHFSMNSREGLDRMRA